jgi:hypothetical protein
MKISIKNKEVELKFTFNSFKYMQDFDITMTQDLETKPFRVLPLLETLLLGAVNSNPKVRFTVEDVQKFLEEYIENSDEENSLSGLIENLMELLEASSFFKSLQKK